MTDDLRPSPFPPPKPKTTLRAISLQERRVDRHPFNAPVIQSLLGKTLAFRTPVTIFVGENGSGKSTLLEGIACATHSIAIGSNDLQRDESMAAGQALASIMKPTWEIGKKFWRGFFLRAEDFFGYAMRVERMKAELTAAIEEIKADESLSMTRRNHALMPLERELYDLRRLYDEGLDARSHGEAFLELFRSRMHPDGLYLLDEPEAPLSPTRQLTLLSMMKMVVEEHEAQIIMATHSPIMMAYPGATILSFDGGEIEAVSYDDVEQISVMRSFLRDPDAYLRHL